MKRSKLYILYIFPAILVIAVIVSYRWSGADEFIKTQFRIATALNGSAPVGISRWHSPVIVVISGDEAKYAPIEQIRREFRDIEKGAGIGIAFSNDNTGNFNIHYSREFRVDGEDRKRFSRILHKESVDVLISSLNTRDSSCFLQVKVLDGAIIGSILFVNTSKIEGNDSCVRANIMAAFGFPLYPLVDKRLDSVMTGKTGRDSVLTETDFLYIKALYSLDPAAAVKNLQ